MNARELISRMDMASEDLARLHATCDEYVRDYAAPPTFTDSILPFVTVPCLWFVSHSVAVAAGAILGVLLVYRWTRFRYTQDGYRSGYGEGFEAGTRKQLGITAEDENDARALCHEMEADMLFLAKTDSAVKTPGSET